MVQYQQENNATVITVLVDRLDMYNVPDLRQKIDELLVAEPKFVIIDLEKVNLVDSSAIGYFFALQNSIKEYGGTMNLANLTAHFHKVLMAIRALSIFAHYKTTAEALDAARSAA